MTDHLRFVDHEGARLAWRAEGPATAPVLILGNSLGSDATSWDAVAAMLSQRYRVIRFDARGHGASVLEAATRGSDFTIAQLARDTLAVADAAGVERFHYTGVSIGGMIGMWLGVHAPGRLQRLVLSNTAARLPAQVWDERMAAVRTGGLVSQVDATLQRWFTPAFHATGDALIARTRASFLNTDPAGYLGCAAAIRDMDQRDALVHIKAPTLVITGQYDPSTPPELGQAVAAAIPGAQIVELALAHMPQLEDPAAYVNVLVKFLDG